MPEAGAVVTHEILESYSAGVESPGTSLPTMEDVANKTDNGKNYLKAHKTAMKQDPRFVEPTIIGDNSSGTGIYYLQQMRKIPGLVDPFPFEKELFKKQK